MALRERERGRERERAREREFQVRPDTALSRSRVGTIISGLRNQHRQHPDQHTQHKSVKGL